MSCSEQPFSDYVISGTERAALLPDRRPGRPPGGRLHSDDDPEDRQVFDGRGAMLARVSVHEQDGDLQGAVDGAGQQGDVRGDLGLHEG